MSLGHVFKDSILRDFCAGDISMEQCLKVSFILPAVVSNRIEGVHL